MVQAIVYTSYAGHTRAYAKLLGKELNVRVFDLKSARETLEKGIEVIYLGWLNAGKVEGFKKACKYFNIKALCAVGMATDDSQLPEIRKTNKLADELPTFVLQGGFDMNKLHGIYKLMMKTMKAIVGKQIANKPDRTPEEDEMLDMMTNGRNCVSKDNLTEVLNWYQSVNKG